MEINNHAGCVATAHWEWRNWKTICCRYIIRSPIYVYGSALDNRDSNGDGTLDERLYVAQDANYNITALFDNSGNVVERYVYDPFGQVTVLDAGWNALAASAFAWLYLHQGGRFDGTSGLYHFRHRDYSPTLGRWTSLDPLRYEAGDVNLYRALENSPVHWLDPSGLDRIDHIPAGNLTLLWYVDEKFIGSDKKFFIGVLVRINGEEFVRRYVGGQPLYVPLAKVNSTTSFWKRTPGNWDPWFRENSVAVHEPSYKNLSMQAGLLPTGYNGLVVGQQQIEALADTAIHWNAGARFNAIPIAASSRTVAAAQASVAKTVNHFDEIARFRQKAGLPAFNAADSATGTVARAVVNDGTNRAYYGLNTSLSPESIPFRMKVVQQLQAKGYFKNVTNIRQAPMLAHAEAHTLMRAVERTKARNIMIYSDRQVCRACQQQLGLLADHLGVTELRVFEMGNPVPYVIRPKP
ncbi:MAG: RHS repeat-associated core domain-containing protein [Thermogemmata sp.]|nr:RHS repeat-associated core domain-containing protein [Thermogemmata sp.]